MPPAGCAAAATLAKDSPFRVVPFAATSWERAAQPILTTEPVCVWLNVSTALSTEADLVATTIVREDVVWSGRRFSLSEPVTLIMELGEGVWCFECPQLDLVGCGHSVDDAISSFESQFAFIWDEIAGEDDAVLLPRARHLKAEMRRLVADIETAA